DLAGRVLDGMVLRDRLPVAAAEREQLRPVAALRADDLLGPVARAVGDDEDLEPVRRVLERERVRELLRDRALLVVRRDDERDRRRRHGTLADWAGMEPGDEPDEEREARV